MSWSVMKIFRFPLVHFLPYLPLFLFFLFLQTLPLNFASEENSSLPGHMKPLGSHMPPLPVRRISHLPSPVEFYKTYVTPKLPVIMEGALSKATVWKRWQNDDYIREHFGNAEVGVEQGKKENRSDPRFTMTISEFLDRYKEEDIYMVYDLPPPMYQEWELPRPLLCGGFQDNLMMTYVWFSSGGTNSVLHTDSYENFHCLVSGKKKFTLIEPHYSEVIGPEHAKKGFYDMNVEKVDMTVYPELSRIPWYLAEVNEGDCLYLPYLWIHNVHSFDRNMGVNIWWMEFTFNEDECPPEEDVPDFVPLGQVGMSPEMMIVEALKRAARPDNTVHAEELYRMIAASEGMQIKLQAVKELFEILQPGCDSVISDYQQIPREILKKGHSFITDIWQEGMSDPSMMSEDELEGLDEEYGGLAEDYRRMESGGEGEELLTDHVTDTEEEEGGGDYDHDEL